MYVPSNLCKIELENEICHLFSTHPVTVNIYLWIQFWNISEYSRMLITQQSGCASGMDCSRNLNLSMKNQNSTHLICIQIVKYWSHRVKFSIYIAFKAFQTSHQLLLKVVVYRRSSRMRVKYSGWLKPLLRLCISAIQSLILILILPCKGC